MSGVKKEKPTYIKQSNSLIEASYRLGINEHKLIRYVASHIHNSDSDFHTYRFRVKDFAEAIGVKGNNYYHELEKISVEILRKPLRMKLNDRWIVAPWFSYISYIKDEGVVELRFDSFFKPFFLNLKNRFTIYDFKQIAKLSSVHSIRIYELLKQYEVIGERAFPIDDLKEKLGIEGEYPRYSNFKQRILMKAKKEIEKKTTLSFDISEQKEGRRVKTIHFKINNQPEKGIEVIDKKKKKSVKTLSEELLVVKTELEIMGVNVPNEILLSWEKQGMKSIYNAMEQFKKRTDIDYPIPYLTKIINSNPKSGAVDEPAREDQQIYKLLNTVKDYYKNTSEPLPNYFVKEKFVEVFQASHTSKEIEELWKTHESHLMDYVIERFKHNKKRAR